MSDTPFNAAPAPVLDKPAFAPETFDFALWLSGVSSIRETVILYRDGAAQQEISRLSVIEATGNREDSKLAAERLAELYAERWAGRLEVVVEARTGAWIAEHNMASKAAGLDEVEATLSQMADQIIEPALTGADLRALHESGAQGAALVDQIAEAVLRVNSAAKLGVDPRFLPAASA